MRCFRIFATCLLVFVFLAVSREKALAESGTSPQQLTQSLIDLYKKMARSTSAQERCALEAKIAEAFDLSSMTQAALQRQRTALGPNYDKTQGDLQWLIRTIAFRDTGDFFDRIEYRLNTPENGHVRIEAYDPVEDLDIDVRFVFQKSKVIDVWVDGNSMVVDYQNQFARIADKDGVDGITNKIADRRSEETSKGLRCSK